MFDFIRQNHQRQKQARHLYGLTIERAKDPFFYQERGIPDEFDSRFDVLTLHAFLVIHRLKAQETGKNALAQPYFDQMFKQVEYGLRELGVGDLSVPKKMKRLMTGFNGRMAMYTAAVNDDKPDVLKAALIKNLYNDNQETALDYTLWWEAYIKQSLAIDLSADSIFPALDMTKGVPNAQKTNA